MPRIPYLLNYDDRGLVTAVTIDGSRCAATDKQTAPAVKRFHKKATEFYEEHRWIPGEELIEASLHERRVSVRPTIEDAHRGRRFPSSEMIRLPIRSVQGKTHSSQQICYLPDLDEAFSVLRGDRLTTLLEEAVRTSARKLSPRELARIVPPNRSELRWISVKRRKKVNQKTKPPTPLEQIASRLDDRSTRRIWRPAWGRDKEVQQAVGFLETRNSNLLLVGPAGVGKTTIVAAAAREIARHRRTDRKGSPAINLDFTEMLDFFSTRQAISFSGSESTANRSFPELWLTNAGRLISGMQYLGQWEERCETLIEELASRGGVLCLESLQDIARIGGREPTESVGAFLAPFIAHNQLRIVAETTVEGLDVCRRLLPGLVDLLEVVEIQSMQSKDSTVVLGNVLKNVNRDKKLEVAEGLEERLDRLYRRLQPYQPMPGPAVNLIDSMVGQAKSESVILNDGLLIRNVHRKTGLPEWLLRDEITLEEREIESHFRDRVVAQPEACREASSIVLRWKAGLNNPNRPLGVLLLCGPSGVGKTHLAKTMAEYLFGNSKVESPLIRLDMSEYSGFGAADRLLTDARDQPSAWIRQVRRQPFAVLLFDEIEKAASDVFDCLLAALDEGRLVDTQGRVTHLEGCVVLMTSNLGSDHKSVGFEKASPHAFRKAVNEFFRPEFFNRLDSVIIFDPLNDDAIERIAEQQLKMIEQREGIRSKGIKIQWTNDVVRCLAKNGVDSRYGVRPMQRHVEREIIAPLARHLAEGASPERVRYELDASGNIICLLDTGHR